MATPHVAGAAALVLDAAPGYTPAQVRNFLVAHATSGKVTSAGTGSPNLLLRVDGALRNPYTPAEVCGSGYQVIDGAPLAGTDGALQGRVYLLYNSGNGYNCTTTLKAVSIGAASPWRRTWRCRGGPGSPTAAPSRTTPVRCAPAPPGSASSGAARPPASATTARLSTAAEVRRMMVRAGISGPARTVRNRGWRPPSRVQAVIRFPIGSP